VWFYVSLVMFCLLWLLGILLFNWHIAFPPGLRVHCFDKSKSSPTIFELLWSNITAIFYLLYAYLQIMTCFTLNRHDITKILLKVVLNTINLTLKNCSVAPPLYMPYDIFDCATKSSADLIGVNSRSIVKNAARLAV
jgi:hypothetical protein